MAHRTSLALIFAAGLWQAPALAADNNVRLLVHGHRQLEGSQFGVAGWLLAPNIAVSAETWLAIAGGRFDADDGWIELMGGFLVQRGERFPVLDLRASSRRLAPLFAWTNLQWSNFTELDASTGYAYLMLDWMAPGKLVMLGVETENFFPARRPARLGAGPNAVLTFDKLSLVAAYQLRDDANELWLRLVINP